MYRVGQSIVDCFFADPPLSPLGAVRDQRKLMADGVNDGVNLAAGRSRPAVAVVIACHLITTQSFRGEEEN
jgi:hypothetical protein